MSLEGAKARSERHTLWSSPRLCVSLSSKTLWSQNGWSYSGKSPSSPRSVRRLKQVSLEGAKARSERHTLWSSPRLCVSLSSKTLWSQNGWSYSGKSPSSPRSVRRLKQVSLEGAKARSERHTLWSSPRLCVSLSSKTLWSQNGWSYSGKSPSSPRSVRRLKQVSLEGAKARSERHALLSSSRLRAFA